MLSKKCIKVSFEGETKRLKPAATFNQLCQDVRQKFFLPKWLPRFYYLDDENELISITQQSDYEEALEVLVSLPSLKLIIAATAQDARLKLERMCADNMSLASSACHLPPPSHRNSTLSRADAESENPFGFVLAEAPKTERLMDRDSLMTQMKTMFKTAFEEV